MSIFSVKPMSLKDVQKYVDENHRHNKAPRHHKFSIGLVKDGEIVGVGVAGLPTARMLNDGDSLEITRTCTDGTRNANSAIYGALVRAARSLGYRRVFTYTQCTESGASLRGAGWRIDSKLAARKGWNTKSRERCNQEYMSVERTRWIIELKDAEK